MTVHRYALADGGHELFRRLPWLRHLGPCPYRSIQPQTIIICSILCLLLCDSSMIVAEVRLVAANPSSYPHTRIESPLRLECAHTRGSELALDELPHRGSSRRCRTDSPQTSRCRPSTERSHRMEMSPCTEFVTPDEDVASHRWSVAPQRIDRIVRVSPDDGSCPDGGIAPNQDVASAVCNQYSPTRMLRPGLHSARLIRHRRLLISAETTPPDRDLSPRRSSSSAAAVEPVLARTPPPPARSRSPRPPPPAPPTA